MAYLLDANTFIEAKNTYYGMDFCPAYWDWLENANAAGRVYSIEKVQNEITAGTDALATWAAAKDARFFLAPDAATLPAFATVSAWANSAGYSAGAIGTFLSVADYYLVAQALAHRYAVVTREVAIGIAEEDQDSRRVHCARCDLSDAVRDAPRGASEIRPATLTSAVPVVATKRKGRSYRPPNRQYTGEL